MRKERRESGGTRSGPRNGQCRARPSPRGPPPPPQRGPRPFPRGTADERRGCGSWASRAGVRGSGLTGPRLGLLEERQIWCVAVAAVTPGTGGFLERAQPLDLLDEFARGDKRDAKLFFHQVDVDQRLLEQNVQ